MTKELTNTWLGGMNTDIDPIYLESDQYMYGENVRVMTKTGVLQSIEGTDVDAITLPSDEIIIGSTTINNIGVIFTKVLRNGVYYYNKVYRVVFDNTHIIEQTVILQGDLKLCVGSEDDNEYTRLSVVGNYETDTNIKVYFTDGSSLTKVLNVVDDKYVGTAPDNPLVDNNGWIIDPESLDTTPSAILYPFVITTLGVGGLPAGMVQYCYQLFNVRGTISAVSPLSGLTHLTFSNTSEGSLKYLGTTQGQSSGKSCVMLATLLDHEFEKCRIIRILYTSNKELAEITIVDETDLVPGQSYINYRDTGGDGLASLTVEEFNSLTGYQFKAVTLDKLDNRLFSANTTEISWNPDYDARAYRANSAGNVVLESANIDQALRFNYIDSMDFDSVPETHDAINPFNVIQSKDFTDSNRYEYGANASGGRERGGLGKNIKYRFIMFKNLASEISPDRTPGFSPSMNVPSLNLGYGILLNTWSGPLTIVTYPVTESRIGNQADPYIDSQFRSLQRDEIYRFGIVLYNNKGIASPVKWIGDIRTPHASDPDFSPFAWDDFSDLGLGLNRPALAGRSLGIQFDILSLPEDVASVEIVRCERTESDRTVIMQTAMNLVANHEYEDPDTGQLGGDLDTRPLLWPTFMSGSVYGVGSVFIAPDDYIYSSAPVGKIKKDYVTMVSPEISIMGEDAERSVTSDTYIDTLYGLSSFMRNDQYLAKFTPRGATYPLLVNSPEGVIKNWDLLHSLGALVTEPLATAYRGLFVAHNDVSALIAKMYVPFGGADFHFVRHNLPISDAKYPALIPWNDSDNLALYYTNVGSISFLNYPRMRFDGNDKDDSLINKRGLGGPMLVAHIPGLIDLVGAFGGVMNEFNNTGRDLYDTYDERVVAATVSTLIGNVKRNIVPYGGNTFSTRSNSIYISTNAWARRNNVAHINCFGGDTYLGILDYPWARMFLLKNVNDHNECKIYVGAYIPFESSINPYLLQGDMTHKTFNEGTGFLDIYLQPEPTLISDWHVQSEPYFVYNPAYSAQPDTKLYVPASIYAEDNVRNRNRIFNSEAKTNNEIIDNWTRVLPANYIDVDNQYGLITNLKTFKNRLFYFQDLALGIAAVNERSLIQDNNIGALTLGTGGILTRFDYVSNTNGDSTINDNSIVNSDNVLYWYDFDKKEICSFPGNAVTQLSKEKQVLMYINRLLDNPSHWLERRNLNSFFDKKYNEVNFNLPLLGAEPKKKSLTFNEQLTKFTSVYTLNTNHALTFSDKTVLLGGGNYYYLNRGDYNGSITSYDNKDAELRFSVNQEPTSVKVFDNVKFDAKFTDTAGEPKEDKTIFNEVTFYTKSQTSIPQNSNYLDYREDTYRFYIERQSTSITEPQLSLPARMRGKNLDSYYKFTVTDDKRFEIPYITTTYRNSLV